MTTSRPARLGRFLGALGALVALLCAVPIALVIASRERFGSPNPLSGVRSPWHWDVDGMLDAIKSPLSDALVVDLIVRTSLIVVWVSIVVIAVTTALEVVHLVRHHGMSMPAVRGLGWSQRIARFIAVGLLVLVPLMSQKASLASSGVIRPGPVVSPTAPTMVSLDFFERDAVEMGDLEEAATNRERAGSTSARAPRIHVVQPGESIYAIAMTLADGTSSSTADVANVILDANLGTEMTGGQRFTNPAYIEVGWELVIPAAVVPRTTVIATTAADHSGIPTLDEPTETQVAEVHVVVAGENLSEIASEHLGDDDQWPLLWEENAGDDMGGGRSFEDPNLILPGWKINIPTASPPPVVRETVDFDAPEPDTRVPDAPITLDVTELPPITAPAPAGSTLPVTAPAPNTAPDTTTPPVTTTPATTTPGVTTPAPTTTAPELADTAPGDAETPRPGSSPAAPSPLSIEHAALLAAGILGLVGVRRRQRLRAAMPRARVPDPPPDVVATERSLRSIDVGERTTRVDVAIRAAAHALVDTNAQVGFLIVGTDGDIEMRLTAPGDLPAPWTPLGSRASWRLDASVPVEMLSNDARQVGTPCVALIQLGVADGRDVLIDLEACGTLAIEAQPDQADQVVTAIAAGLATSPYAEVAHLVAVSLPPNAFLGHRNAQYVESVRAALESAASLAGSTLTNERTSFSLRSLRTGGEMWEPAVVLFAAADRPDLATVGASLPVAGHGLAVVASVEPESLDGAPARLVAGADGWTLVAFGSSTQMTPIGVSASELRQIADVLADADAPLIADDFETLAGTVVESAAIVAPHVVATTDDDRSDDETSIDDDDGAFVPMNHQIIVRLMGGVDVVSRDGEAGRFERSKTVELIAWLATHRDKSTRTAARTALWELDVRDATFANVVSEARRALGRLVPPVDDEEWLARTLTEQLPLHRAVVTDAQLIRERLTEARVQPPAQAVRTLRPPAEMIRDIPFASTGYLWPDAEGITSNLVLLATSVTTELAAHALSLGDIDLVFWATGQGLTVLPGHEELIGLRMRAHARAGDLAGVRQEWESYERVIVADAWSDGEPAPKLLALRRELLTTPT